MHTGQRLAPAKLNLTLEVLHKRSDGFHTLRSVAVPIGLYDELRWSPSSSFSFSCSDSNLCSEDNLVVQAAKAIGLETQPWALHLEKRIPYGSGLGGGSSDAAALLLAAIHGEFGPQPSRDWVQIARSIGSDVPLFLLDAPALVEATGERVTALGANPSWWAVLLCPSLAVSTRDAYAMLDAQHRNRLEGATSRTASVSIAMAEALQQHDFAQVTALLSNDFEATIFAMPMFATALALWSEMHVNAHLSGSGSTLFTLCEDESEATTLAHRLRTHLQNTDLSMQIFAVPFMNSSSWNSER